MNRSQTRYPVFLAAALFLAGCAAGAPAPSAPAPSAALPVPGNVHWFRTAAEQRAVYEQIYAWAGERVAAAARDVDGPWGVILDADETVLDNSLYQLRRARAGLGFTPDSWNDWVREEAAPALPGAVAFIRGVRSLGGRVAIVTNRDDVVCDATRRNLRTVGVEADVVLCRPPGSSEKETRFRAVAEGTTPPGLPPLRILAWVGDNIQDFPGGSQDLRTSDPGAFGDFGTRFFVLPNPMYGSWERNPGG
ncbi:MAG TPA: HAD family acid phosphatase [Longimicrobiales bacterium]|nr:HAD family acid phosphatase [Longimicrobiales bacterium]